MATHSSILAWEILWTEEPGGLQSMRSQLDTTEYTHIHTPGMLMLIPPGQNSSSFKALEVIPTILTNRFLGSPPILSYPALGPGAPLHPFLHYQLWISFLNLPNLVIFEGCGLWAISFWRGGSDYRFLGSRRPAESEPWGRPRNLCLTSSQWF